MKKFTLILSFLSCCYFSIYVEAYEITISGSIVNQMGEPSSNSIILAEPNEDFPGQVSGKNFTNLGRTQSDELTGKFSIKIDNSDITMLVIGIWYAVPEYYIIKNIDFSKDQKNLEIQLPNQNSSNNVATFEFTDIGKKLNLLDVGFKCDIFSKNISKFGRLVNFTSREKIVYSQRYLKDLPDGEYVVSCRIFSRVEGNVITKSKKLIMTLPIKTADKKVLVNFEKVD